MSFQYLIGKNKYHFSYKELREHYIKVCQYSSEEFMQKLPEVLHLACIIAFLKEIPNEHIVGDEGIIHQIAHLLHNGECELIKAKNIQKQFKRQLKIS